MAAERAAFRSLLRACRRADKHPSSLLGLVGRPPRMYNGAQNREVRMLWPGSPFAEDMIWEALGKSTQFAHPKPGRGGARHGCRQHRARALLMDMPYLQEAQELYQRFSDAFQVMTEIETTVESEDDSYRAEPRPGGVPQVLKSFDPQGFYQILPGDFLMTHPISCIAEPVFDQAVVILHTNSDHPLTDSGVVRGLVLNKRLNTTFKQLLERAQDPQDKKWAEKLSEVPAAAELRVFRGGPVIVGSSLQANIDWVHSFPDVSEAQQVAPGVWFGGKIEEVLERAAACEEEEPPLRIMLGYAAWSTQQLQIELECGVWCRARPPQDDLPLQGGADKSSVSAKLCFDEDGAEAWRTALFQAGQDLLAQFPRAPGVDARIRGHMKRFEMQNRSKS